MKIVFITPSYSPNIGGVERHIAGIVKLLALEYQITIITEQRELSQQTHEQTGNIQIFRIPVSSSSEKAKKWQIWKWVSTHKKILDEADIIHVHDVMFWLYPYKLTHLSKKIYITFHGWEGTYPIPIKNIVLHKLNEIIAYKNLCVGDFIARWYHTHPDAVTYGAVTAPMYPEHQRQKTSTLVFIGRLDQDTGFMDCLKIYKKLQKELNWELIVVGDGPLRHLVPPDIKILGMVPDPEKYISKADYVFASGYLTMLESFAHQKIVMSSYHNFVRQDYIKMHPMARHIFISGFLPKHSSEEAYNWAKQQTWQKLVNQYKVLWQK